MDRETIGIIILGISLVSILSGVMVLAINDDKVRNTQLSDFLELTCTEMNSHLLIDPPHHQAETNMYVNKCLERNDEK